MNYCCSFDHILSYEEFEERVKCIDDYRTHYVNFYYPKESAMKVAMKLSYQVHADRHALHCKFLDNHICVHRPYRKTIDYYYKQKLTPSAERNRMGCLESWYDPFYAITQTLHPNEVDDLSDDQLESLLKVVHNVQEALY